MTKRCPTCGIGKEITEFHKNKTHADGHASECKLCVALRVKKWRESNIDYVKVSAKARYEKNIDAQRQRARERHHANKDRAKERGAAWREANRESIKAKKRLEATGFTEACFSKALLLQKGSCAICGVKLGALPRRQIHADHDHKSGKPRGVLCHHCNCGIGHLKDSAALLQAAITYLNSPPLGSAV